MICNKSDLVLVLSNNQDSSRNRAGTRAVKSIVNTPKKYTRIIVQIINDPTSYFWEIFFLKVFNKVIYFYVRELCKDCTVNLTTNRISLALIQYTTIVGEVFVDQFDKDLRIELNILMNQDCLESFEELSCELRFLFSRDEKSTQAHRRGGFDDLVFVVTGEDESAVVIKRLNVRP